MPSSLRLNSAEGWRSCEYFIDYFCLPPLDSNSVEATGSLTEGGSEFSEAMTLFPASDAEALAGLLDRFLYNADRFAAARRHAWELGQNRFNWDRQKVQWLETIAGVNTC